VVITTFYAGLLAILFFVLSMRVVAVRGRVSLGDGGDEVVLRRMRGHANFAEYVPFILLMMALLEYGHAPRWQLHAMGLTLVVARLLHGIALSFTPKWRFGRFYGALLTLVLLATCGMLCIWRGTLVLGIL